MALQNKKPKSITKPLVMSTIIVVALVAGYGLYAYAFDNWPFSSGSDTTTETASNSDRDDPDFIDDQPATDEDQELANQHKQQEYEQQNKSDDDDGDANKSSRSLKSVDVTLTTFYIEGDELHANGFVAGVVESGGTCTLIVTNESGKSVSVSRKGHINATNTTCGQSTIELSKLTPGKWTPELRYESDTSRGTTGPNAWNPIEVN